MGGSEPQGVRRASIYKCYPGKVCQRLSGKEVLQQGEPGLGSQSPRRGRKSLHGCVPVWGKRESAQHVGAGAPSWGRGQGHNVVCRWGVRM